MSVSDAKQKLENAAYARWPDDTLNMDEWREAIDRLILEVRAEMPCPRSWVPPEMHVGPIMLGGCEGWPEQPACPSCAARAELEKISVPAT